MVAYSTMESFHFSNDMWYTKFEVSTKLNLHAWNFFNNPTREQYYFFVLIE